ncbi:response regulator [Metabacillus lacus]|nr:response regulator [Metabacillus lacus]
MMNKYQQKLLNTIRSQLDNWLNSDEQIPHLELYRFIHSLAGTASTIGLTSLGNIAASLHHILTENEERKWTTKDVQIFLLPLLSALYNEELKSENLQVAETNSDVEQELIMLIDDDTTLLMFLKDELEKDGYSVMAYADPERALASFYDLNPDCVVIDVHMKSQHGLQVLNSLKELMQKSYVPTIMISVDSSKETRVQSYSGGADDFILKPFDLEEFKIRLGNQLQKKRSIDELVLVDELTRLYNRRFLAGAFERLMNQMSRENVAFSIAILDLDHFKNINDTYGHPAGDKVLMEFANIMRQQMRPSDLVFRYGGEEFLILLPKTDGKTAKQVLERILSELHRTEFISEDSAFRVSFSAGVMEIRESNDLQIVLDLVDGALYEAKAAGRKNVKLAAFSDILPRKKVLNIGVVDDDPIIRTILQDLFKKSQLNEQFQLEMKAFKDGMEFIESGWYKKKAEPYFMILDGMMPKMDGLEVLQKIRGFENQNQFTVVMLTSRKGEQDVARALKLGADDYLTKPFKLLELESRLTHLVKRMSEWK